MAKIETINVNSESYELRDSRIEYTAYIMDGVGKEYYLPYFATNQVHVPYGTLPAGTFRPTSILASTHNNASSGERNHRLITNAPSSSDNNTHFRVGLDGYADGKQNWIDLRFNQSGGYEGIYASNSTTTTESGHWLIYHNGTRTVVSNSPVLNTSAATTQTASDNTARIATTAFTQAAINRRWPSAALNISASGTVSCSSGTATQLCTWTNSTGSAGLAIVMCCVQFPTNATGIRNAYLQYKSSSSASASGTTGCMRTSAVSGNYTIHCFPLVYRMAAGGILVVMANQNSSSSLSVVGALSGKFIID